MTAVISGTVRMDGRELERGRDRRRSSPASRATSVAVTDAVVVAVKLPAVAGDKYLVED